MSRGRGKGRRAARGAAGEARPRNRTGKRAVLYLAGAVIALVAAVAILPLSGRRGPARVSPEEALQRGLAASNRGEDRAAEAWFRRGLAASPGDPLLASNLCVALNNQCFRVTMRRGRAWRERNTSRDRVRAAQESFRLYASTESALPPGANFDRDRAQIYQAWAMPLEALDQLRLARAHGDTSAATRDGISRILQAEGARQDPTDPH